MGPGSAVPDSARPFGGWPAARWTHWLPLLLYRYASPVTALTCTWQEAVRSPAWAVTVALPPPVAFTMPSESVATYGLPIKEFFIWGDDVEYTRRIALREPSYLVEDSQVLHDTKNNVGSNIVYDDERIDRYRYAYRNEMYIALHEGWKRRVYQQLKIWYHIAKILLKSSQKKRKIRLILSASKEGKTFNPSIEYISDER